MAITKVRGKYCVGDSRRQNFEGRSTINICFDTQEEAIAQQKALSRELIKKKLKVTSKKESERFLI